MHYCWGEFAYLPTSSLMSSSRIFMLTAHTQALTEMSGFLHIHSAVDYFSLSCLHCGKLFASLLAEDVFTCTGFRGCSCPTTPGGSNASLALPVLPCRKENQNSSLVPCSNSHGYASSPSPLAWHLTHPAPRRLAVPDSCGTSSPGTTGGSAGSSDSR